MDLAVKIYVACTLKMVKLQSNLPVTAVAVFVLMRKVL